MREGEGSYLIGVFGDNAAHECLGDRLWLLMDFLLHEVIVVALHDRSHLHLQDLSIDTRSPHETL